MASSAGDSPRFTGSERGSRPGQGGAPQADSKERPLKAGFRKWDLELVGCLLPWEEGEEGRILSLCSLKKKKKGAQSAP